LNCVSCLLPIADLRKETHCSICNGNLHKDCAIKEDGKHYCDTCYTVKEEDKTTQTNVDIDVPDVIRRSYIETYRACPLKFYHEVIKGVPSPPNIYTQMGIDLHEMFDKASQNKDFIKSDMQKHFESIFHSYPDSLFGDVEKIKMYNRGVNSIDTFYKVISEMGNPFKTEETIQFSVGDDLPLVQTTSDRIDEVNGELEMSDWKTGQVMVGQKLSTDLQAPLYILGVRDKFQMPVRKFTFYYLEDNKTRVFERLDDERYVCTVNKRQYFVNITETKKEVQRILTQIKKGQFNIPQRAKNMYYTCKMCHLQQLEICKGADIESWRQYNNFGRT